jgi:hypothetical protein
VFAARQETRAPGAPVGGLTMSTIPPVEHPIWEMLVTGEVTHKFSLFAANMVLDRIKRTYVFDKTSKARGIQELQKFFEQYERLTASELASII